MMPSRRTISSKTAIGRGPDAASSIGTISVSKMSPSGSGRRRLRNPFLAEGSDVIAPTLRRDDVVVLDNLPAHKVTGIREAIAARRAQPFHLPPYSPDMNPIEMAFAKLK